MMFFSDFLTYAKIMHFLGHFSLVMRGQNYPLRFASVESCHFLSLNFVKTSKFFDFVEVIAYFQKQNSMMHIELIFFGIFYIFVIFSISQNYSCLIIEIIRIIANNEKCEQLLSLVTAHGVIFGPA